MTKVKSGGAHAPNPHIAEPRPKSKAKTHPAPHQETKPQHTSRREAPSAQVAARQGMDTGVQRAQIAARLPSTARASAAASAGAAAARRGGLDAYSQPVPRTGQPRHNPDANRLVNREKLNGGELFPARLKKKAVQEGLQLFGKDGNPRGEVKGDSRFDLDFGKKRRINGEMYVLARGVEMKNGKVTEGYVRLSDKYINYNSAFNFGVRGGEPRPTLYDSNLNRLPGELHGDVKGVRLNFGQRMEVGTPGGRTENYYLVFDTRLAHGPHASAWIKESDLDLSTREKQALHRMPAVQARRPPAGADFTAYRIEGSNPDRTVTVRRGDHTSQTQFGNLKFAARRNGGVGNMEAGDYMTRDSRTVNMLHSLPGGDGGVSNNTFLADSGVTFHRWNNKQPPSVDVPLYDPYTRQVARGADGRQITMKFVYGYVDTAAGREFGWMAYENLRR
jgi:hypothetical protein